MANTVTVLGGIIDISVLTEDWDLADTFVVDDGIYIDSVKLCPGAAGDYVTIRQGSVSGPVVSVLKSIDGATLKDPIQKENMIPSIKFEVGECSLTAGFHIVITGKNGKEF